MDLGLRDRVCLVTGSTAGIGLETAKLLAAEGARVIVTGRDAARTEQARAESGAAFGLAADLSDAGSAGRLVSRAAEELGPVECLVNNVGEAYQFAFDELTDEQWEEHKKGAVAQAHNAKGLAALTRKKFDVAVAEFKAAADNDPQPAYLVRQASALESAGKHDEAIALCDKVLADAQVHPQIKQVAQSIRAQAAKASGKK